MLYDLAHFIKDKCSFLWDAVEWGNAIVFSLLHKKALQGIPQLLKNISNETFTLRMTNVSDATKLEKFFEEQPESAFEFFKPHDFDGKTIQKILRNKAFFTFVVTEHDNIVGYFFLRAFVNGKCFRGPGEIFLQLLHNGRYTGNHKKHKEGAPPVHERSDLGTTTQAGNEL